MPSITAPTLSATDNADGTGAVATLASGDAGATNAVYYQAVSPSIGTTWTSGGSRTGPGTVDLSITTTGLYWLKCESTLADETVLSNLVLLGVTDDTDAVHERILQAVAGGLRTLAVAGSLPGLTQANQVFDQFRPEANVKIVRFPAVVVTPGLPGQSEQELPGTTQRDDIGYPVAVVFLDRVDGDYTPKRPTYLLARQRIYRYFRNQRLSGISEVYYCKVEPSVIIDPKASDYSLTASALVLRFTSREVRGI